MKTVWFSFIFLLSACDYEHCGTKISESEVGTHKIQATWCKKHNKEKR